MYFHLHRNSKKFDFFIVKFLKCESFLIALRRNSKKWTFLLHKIHKSRPFYSLSVETLKSDIIIAKKVKNYLFIRLC